MRTIRVGPGGRGSRKMAQGKRWSQCALSNVRTLSSVQHLHQQPLILCYTQRPHAPARCCLCCDMPGVVWIRQQTDIQHVICTVTECRGDALFTSTGCQAGCTKAAAPHLASTPAVPICRDT
jgi:hypothetical protein